MAFENDIFSLIVLLIGSVGVILGVFFSTFLIANYNRLPKQKIFLIIYLLVFSLRIGKSLIYNYYPIDPILRNVFLGLLLSIGPSLFLYIKYSINTVAKLKLPVVFIHYMPSMLFMALCFYIPNNGSTASWVIFYGLNTHIILYGLYSIYTLKRMDAILDKNLLKWLYLLSVLTIFAGVFFLSFHRVFGLPYVSLPLGYSGVILMLSFWALKNPQLFKRERPKYAKSLLSRAEVENHMEKLSQLMLDEKLYLDPTLTLTKLSNRLKISNKELSQTINQLTKENYSRYIASLRVEAAKLFLLSKEKEHYKIAAIAYDSGFNSLSSFNASFKQLTGVTAIEFREKA